MGRKRISDDDRKENITFRLPKWLVIAIKSTPGYNLVVEEILSKFFKRTD